MPAAFSGQGKRKTRPHSSMKGTDESGAPLSENTIRLQALAAATAPSASIEAAAKGVKRPKASGSASFGSALASLVSTALPAAATTKSKSKVSSTSASTPASDAASLESSTPTSTAASSVAASQDKSKSSSSKSVQFESAATDPTPATAGYATAAAAKLAAAKLRHKQERTSATAPAAASASTSASSSSKTPRVLQAPEEPQSMAALLEARLEAKRRARLRERRLLLLKDHVSPPAVGEIERRLARLATQGVVTLFNAVSRQQKALADASTEPEHRPGDKAAKEREAKRGFLELLRKGGKPGAATASSSRAAASSSSSSSSSSARSDFVADDADTLAVRQTGAAMDADEDFDAARSVRSAMTAAAEAKAGTVAKVGKQGGVAGAKKDWKVLDDTYMTKHKKRDWNASESEGDSDADADDADAV